MGGISSLGALESEPDEVLVPPPEVAMPEGEGGSEEDTEGHPLESQLAETAAEAVDPEVLTSEVADASAQVLEAEREKPP